MELLLFTNRPIVVFLAIYIYIAPATCLVLVYCMCRCFRFLSFFACLVSCASHRCFLPDKVAMLCFVVACSQSSLICVGHCRLWQVSIETSCYFLLLLADSCVVRCALLVNFNLSVCFKLDKCPTDFRPALLVLLFLCALLKVAGLPKATPSTQSEATLFKSARISKEASSSS